MSANSTDTQLTLAVYKLETGLQDYIIIIIVMAICFLQGFLSAPILLT